MSLRRAEELPPLIRALNRSRSPQRTAALARELIDILHPMREAAVARRDAAVLRLHDSGHTLEVIGQITGLTRARVHQIVRRTRIRPDRR